MTITESELREILTGEGREDHHRGVTVADVDRRVRVIRRRRLRVVGAVAGLGIVAGLAFTVPQVKNTVVPENIWTGVMAQPAKTPRIVHAPSGAPNILGDLGSRTYREGGVRKEFVVATEAAPFSVRLWCSGPPRKAALWIDGKLVEAGPCGEKDGQIYVVPWDGTQDNRVSKHIVAGAVLEAEARIPEQLNGTADVEHLLAASERFDVKWELKVNRLGYLECRDGVYQVDPGSGEIVQLQCDNEPKTPSFP
ncbi:hypothetical protein [Streptosporangium sp. 'caverna']|uniref:hypothetical protein n=1 Tax=Streptosporangium sp. 'caverna' TaxID=2202249 RepID=UPI000D7D4F40|nr:hypothetical protein [Streptosporangium sp. 'caverna']AWS45377.1 hypothetical protein DKM19_32690 [Streptosporangium sp. 'caverna']